MKINVDYIPILSTLPALDDMASLAYQCYLRYRNPESIGPAPSPLPYSTTVLQKGSFSRALCLFVPILGNIIVYFFDCRNYVKLSDSLDVWVQQQGTDDEQRARSTAKDRILQCFWENKTSLDLKNLNLTTLPACISTLSRLERLHLNNNQLTELPKEIGTLSSLWDLNLKDNKLTSLPQEICTLSSLQMLNLKDNQLTSLPKEIGTLSILRILDLNNNQLTELPKEIGTLSSLQILELNNNRLTELPPEIGTLSSLQMLNLKDNQLTSLPQEIGTLSSLQMLNLPNNQLRALPPEVGTLSSLQVLNLSNNQLRALPPEVGTLSSLKFLFLISNSDLSRLPQEEMMALASLELLAISSTNIRQEIADAILANARSARNARARDSIPGLLEAFGGNTSSFSKQFPFLKEWEHKDAGTLAEWLRRLKNTREYQLSSIGIFTDAVVDIVRAAGDDDAFKDRFLNIAEANNRCCEDRAAMAFGEIYSEWRLHMLEKSQASLEQKTKLLLRAALTMAVRAAMNEILPSGGESVESFLYCEIEINKRDNFPLLTLSTGMLYERIGRGAEELIPKICNKALARFEDIFLDMDAFAALVPKEVTSDIEKSSQEKLEPLDPTTFVDHQLYLDRIKEIEEEFKKNTLNARKVWLEKQLGKESLEQLLSHPETWGRD